MWPTVLGAFLISLFFTPVVIFLATRLGIVTDAKTSKHPAHTHQGILPRAGGLPIFLGILLPLFFFIGNKIVFFLLLGATTTVIIGLLDDKYDLSPYLRFGANFIVAAIAVAGGAGIPYITNPFDTLWRLDQFTFSFNLFGSGYELLWLADLVAVLWIVWCMNMVNWSKGVDGQLPGFVAITAFFLGLLSLRFSQHDISKEIVTIVCFVTAGSFLGFLPWNFYPQKILPGYAAGSLAGYLLGVLSILSWGKLGTMLLLLILPLADALIVISRRILQKRSPFKGDRFHFHHTLLSMGWSRRRIAIFYWLVSLIVGSLTLFMNSTEKIYAFLLLLVLLSGIVVWSFYFVKNEN
jgi:UDP-GlcNAc:undecaprenyl-phosphate/decaprenyl-phosphate GlcNAc-1-phosphate transferase